MLCNVMLCYVCMYVYMYVCMYVYMYVCMYVCIEITWGTVNSLASAAMRARVRGDACSCCSCNLLSSASCSILCDTALLRSAAVTRWFLEAIVLSENPRTIKVSKSLWVWYQFTVQFCTISQFLTCTTANLAKRQRSSELRVWSLNVEVDARRAWR